MLKVYKECCGNCLLSKDRIVSPRRAKQLLKEIAEKKSYFVCHKASMNNEKIVCKKFFDELGHQSQMIRIAERLNLVQFVEQIYNEKLTPYIPVSERKKTIVDKRLSKCSQIPTELHFDWNIHSQLMSVRLIRILRGKFENKTNCVITDDEFLNVLKGGKKSYKELYEVIK